MTAHTATVLVLTERHPSGTFAVSEGEVVAVMQSGRPVEIVTTFTPGDWEVEAESLAAAPNWPLLVMPIPAAHATAFAALVADRVDELIRRARAAGQIGGKT